MQPRLCSRGYLQSRGEGQRPLVYLQEDSQGQRDVGIPLHLLAVRQSGSQVAPGTSTCTAVTTRLANRYCAVPLRFCSSKLVASRKTPSRLATHLRRAAGASASSRCRPHPGVEQTHIPVSAVSTDVRTTLNMTLASMRSPNAPSRDIPPRCLRCLETLEIGVSRQAARQLADAGPPEQRRARQEEVEPGPPHEHLCVSG